MYDKHRRELPLTENEWKTIPTKVWKPLVLAHVKLLFPNSTLGVNIEASMQRAIDANIVAISSTDGNIVTSAVKKTAKNRTTDANIVPSAKATFIPQRKANYCDDIYDTDDSNDNIVPSPTKQTDDRPAKKRTNDGTIVSSAAKATYASPIARQYRPTDAYIGESRKNSPIQSIVHFGEEKPGLLSKKEMFDYFIAMASSLCEDDKEVIVRLKQPPSSAEKPFKCQVCSEKFYCKEHLRLHFQHVHQPATEDEDSDDDHATLRREQLTTPVYATNDHNETTAENSHFFTPLFQRERSATPVYTTVDHNVSTADNTRYLTPLFQRERSTTPVFQRTEMLVHMCPDCDVRCATRCELVLHLHADHPASEAAQAFVCKFCGKKTKTVQLLNSHELLCEKTVKCPDCDERFSAYNLVEIHYLQTHCTE